MGSYFYILCPESLLSVTFWGEVFCPLALEVESFVPDFFSVSVLLVFSVLMEDDLADMWGKFSLMEEENVGVSVGNNELEPLVSRGEACVVGKIQSDRVIPKEFFKAPLIRAWRPSGAVSFRVMGENLFLADFENSWDKTRILEGRPWLLDGNLISVADFDGTTPPAQITFDNEALWIRMYNLLLSCMGKEVGKNIGASVGMVDEIDILDDEVGWGEYLRVRIVLDLTKPLARGRMLHLENKFIWIPFKYEKIPKFCYSCGVIKHGKTGCRNKGNRRSGSCWFLAQGNLSWTSYGRR
jgi:hypothetical protein